ncbi:MAG: TIGR01906 family membrane protein [Chloroflexota bacterium]|nr:TIGR01906 family membrane protein [Chloroflexota bacterium]
MKTIKKIAQSLITILVPIVLVLGVVRVLMTPLFVQIEYRSPNFPADSYGFTLKDRLRWSKVAVKYLLNDAGIEYLGGLQFDDGSALYNQRELKHMLDVKIVVIAAMRVLHVSLAVMILVGVWAYRGEWWWEYRKALSRGGWLTVGLLLTLIVGIALNFTTVFVAFHRVFFEGETWIFLYSDTLIRLFPVRFWRDAFVLVGVLALGGGAAIGYACGRRAVSKNNEDID